MDGSPAEAGIAPTGAEGTLELSPGLSSGRYRKLFPLGRGGMADVYEAYDTVLMRPVAYKKSRVTTQQDLERFHREARVAAQLNHPNLVTVFDYGQEPDGEFFICMELLVGEDLKDLMATPLSLDERLALMGQICDGLACAHSRQVVHRDLKPANIHVLPGGHVKIMDFGLAKPVALEMTREGALLGTPNYMSPEQVRGEKADTRSDVFSLGAVFYELLAKRKPFDADSLHAVLLQVTQSEPEPLLHLVPDLPPAVVRLIEKAMAKHPSERFADAGAMREALRAVRAQLSSPADSRLARTAADGGPAVPDEGNVVAEGGQAATEGEKPEPVGSPLTDNTLVVPLEAPPPPAQSDPADVNGPGARAGAETAHQPSASPVGRRPVTKRWGLLVIVMIALMAGMVFVAGRGFGTPKVAVPQSAPPAPTVVSLAAVSPVPVVTAPEPTLPPVPAPPARRTPRQGMVVISSDPSDADVSISSRGVSGSSPLEMALPVGAYQVEVRKEGYFTQTTDFIVRAGQTVSVQVALVAVPKLPSAVDPSSLRDRIYDVKDVEVPPRKIAGTTPSYPKRLPLPKGEDVVVSWAVVVDENGVVNSMDIVKSGGPVLDEIARQEVTTNWRFEPGQKTKGLPVKVRVIYKWTIQRGQ